MFNRVIRCGAVMDDKYVAPVSPELVIEDGVFIEKNPLERKKLYCEEMFKIANLQAAGVQLQECYISTHDTLASIEQVNNNFEYMAIKKQALEKPVDNGNGQNVEPSKTVSDAE